MRFLMALIGAVLELIHTRLFVYYFAAIFVAFSFVLIGYFIRRAGKE